jgi:hypothetical protein
MTQSQQEYVEYFQKSYLWDYLALTSARIIYERNFTCFEFWRENKFSMIEIEKIETFFIDEKYEIQENRIILCKKEGRVETPPEYET